MNDVPLLRNSERLYFRRCPQKHFWRYGEHLVPIQFNTGPLVFGGLGHLALAEYYPPGTKRGPHPAETWDKITVEYIDQVRQENPTFIDDDVEITWDDARSLGHDILVNYVEEYGADDHWEVVSVEDAGKQFIPHPLIKGKAIVNYCFTLDLIVRDHASNGRIRFVDHKFMKSIQKKHLYIDSQPGGYLAIATHLMRRRGLIRPDEAVRDLVYNFIRKQRPPDKARNRFGEYLNKDGSVAKVQPAAFFDRTAIPRTRWERNQQIKDIQSEALAIKAFKTKKLPLFKNPTKDCSWDCEFFTMCGVHQSGGDVESMKKALFKKEDPYKEYYEDAISPKRLQGD